MRIHKLYIAIGLLIAFGVFFELAAHADETNESTKITFSAPVQIPGHVLPAGTYLFEQADPGDQNVIRILNTEGTVTYGMVETISTERAEATGDASITLAEPKAGNPILVKWFYPGRTIGHEFLYTDQQERGIAQASQQTFVGNQLVSGVEAGE